MKIIKLLNHKLSETQKADLWERFQVVELPENLKNSLSQCGSDITALTRLADDIIAFAKNQGAKGFLLPGGSPAFNAIFSSKIADMNFVQLFSHSVRDFKEITNADGSISKTNIFKHIEWIMVNPLNIIPEGWNLEVEESPDAWTFHVTSPKSGRISYPVPVGRLPALAKTGKDFRLKKGIFVEMEIWSRWGSYEIHPGGIEWID